MNASRSLHIASLASAIGLALASPAFAQDAPAPGAQAEGTAADDEEIVVTARRVEESAQDVPISMTVYNQEQLSKLNVVSSTDLATYTPSLQLNGRFGPEKASFVIRGFSQDLNTLPTVAVYFADVVALRLSSNTTSGNGAGPGSMFDLQNVQVLKGPQGTLFGRNTTGGAILLVPQRPTDQLEGYVEGTIGNYDQRRLQAVLNVPLTEGLAIRAGVDWNKRDGYIKSLSGIGPKDFNDVDYLALRFSMLAQLLPNLENYLLFTWSKSDTNGTLGKPVYCNRTPLNGFGPFSREMECAALDAQANFDFYEASNANPDAFNLNKQWQFINTTTWTVSDSLTIKNIFSFGEAKEAYSLNINGDNTPTPFVTTYPGLTGPQGHQRTITEELQFQGTAAGGRLTWQAGGYMERSRPLSPQEQYTSIFSRCTNVYLIQCAAFVPLVTIPSLGITIPVNISSVSVARNNYKFRNNAVYAQGTFDITEQFSITAGARYTWDWTRGTGDGVTFIPNPNGTGFLTTFPPATLSPRCSQAANPATRTVEERLNLLTNGLCLISFTQKSNKPTWLIDLDYKPTEDILIYAKYARGYRGGGVNPSNVGAETWEPEKIDSYEIGAKVTFRGSVRGTFNIAGFWNDFSNQQSSVFIPNCSLGQPGCSNPAPVGINGIQNIGKSRLKGIEVDGTLVLFDDFRLDYGYTYLKAKVKESGPQACDSTRFNCGAASFLRAGDILPFSPKHRLTVTGTYTLPLDESIGTVSIGATYTYTAKQIFSYANAPLFAAGAIPFDAGILPSQSILNLNLNWDSIAGSPVDLALFVTNLTNDKYWVGAGNAFSSTGAEFIILGQPRFYGARVKFRFGD